MIETGRRGFIKGLISFAVAAPAIVRATSIMPVKSLVYADPYMLKFADIMREAFIPKLYVQVYESHPLLKLFGENRA